MIALGDEAKQKVLRWVFELRRQGFWVELDYSPRSLKAQMKRADRLGSKRVFIIGDEEIASGKATLRNMTAKTQTEVSIVDPDTVLHLKESMV
jgi:histidyl-tRNA synthetase